MTKQWTNSNPVPGNVSKCLTEMGIEFRQRGDECSALCPNREHHDTSPSWSVNTATGMHNCFSCGFAGTFAYLVSYMGRTTYEDAALWCRKRGGIEKARAYLEREPKKGPMPQKETALARFDYPPSKPLAERLLSLDSCMDLGVLWDSERELWITPIRDPRTNKLWGWQEKNARHFRNYPLDVTKSKTLFGLDAYRNDGVTKAILVESPLDVVRLRSVGVVGGLASFGVGVSDAQLAVLTDVASSLVLALDNDDAGLAQSSRIRGDFRRLPIRCFNYGDSGAKDPGELGANQIYWGIENAYSFIRRTDDSSRS